MKQRSNIYPIAPAAPWDLLRKHDGGTKNKFDMASRSAHAKKKKNIAYIVIVVPGVPLGLVDFFYIFVIA